MNKDYKTVLGTAEAEITEKKSQFIGFVASAESEQQAEEIIDSVRKKHKTATHNVFAYIVNNNGTEIPRMSDDGEPSGTAGVPILEVIRGEALTNVVIVVTRYFGGTLLGTGGLVRAYTKSAQEALKASTIIEKKMYARFKIDCSYDLFGKLQHEIVKSATIMEILYLESIQLDVVTLLHNAEALEKEIINMTNAKAKLQRQQSCLGYELKGKLFID